MSTEYSGKTLSMSSNAVYQGTYTHNGILQKLHENAFTMGYSNMKEPDGTVKVGGIPFGNAVFMDANTQENVIFASVPTVTDAVPKCVGVMLRMASVAGGQPVNNDAVMAYNKGIICVEGYVNYKTLSLDTAGVVTAVDFDDIRIGTIIYANASGNVCTSTAKPTGGFTLGKIVQVNTDSKSFTIHIQPVVE